MSCVTHDQVEAMMMADKIVAPDRGSVAPVGSPLELYSRPSGLFAASFIGSPTTNLIKGAPADKRGAATIGIWPEHSGVSAIADEWPVTARLAGHLGSDTFVHADADGVGALTSRLEGEAPLKPDQRIFATPHEANLHRFDEGGRIN
jgi:multiple sugar transport system ATP-binding protein